MKHGQIDRVVEFFCGVRFPWRTVWFRWRTVTAALDAFDCGEPSRCAVVAVESGHQPLRFDGDDIPSSAGIERRSQLLLSDGVRASIGTVVAEAQDR